MTDNDEKREVSIEVEGKAFWVDIDKPRTIKELAFFLKRHRGYISAMKKAGFTMPVDPVVRQGLASIADAWRWLTEHPEFTYNGAYKTAAPKMKTKSNGEVSNADQ